jgi:putative pyruvate formate lyase activating enzyme
MRAGELRPAYLGLPRGELETRLEAARAELVSCHACPRQCGVNRAASETGVCRVGRHALVVSAHPHFGEEDCLRGRHGSGTIFFGSCNLSCVFCHNQDISQQRAGCERSAAEMAALMLGLQEEGCHNINLVTPEHVVPQVIEALAQAIPAGLRIPIVYNTSAYDSLSSLRLLDGIVDIYMPDFKVWTRESGRRLLRAADYADCAREAITAMHGQVGPLVMDDRGVAVRGVLVRHLVMPGMLEETAAIFEWLAREVSRDTCVNIMGQYHPANLVGVRMPDGTRRYEDINRYPTEQEMEAAYAAARRVGLWRFDERQPFTVRRR